MYTHRARPTATAGLPQLVAFRQVHDRVSGRARWPKDQARRKVAELRGVASAVFAATPLCLWRVQQIAQVSQERGQIACSVQEAQDLRRHRTRVVDEDIGKRR
jgi:hypothetical protein